MQGFPGKPENSDVGLISEIRHDLFESGSKGQAMAVHRRMAFQAKESTEES